ncbi:hypothetical protein [Nocardia panacis]|uniref:hypothetical protein n=1 Tax=Nocardia panacis TaxID=2340916 RepID=UPI0011C3DE62|nr:hypothetical protein [Nocardia panacis]
MPHDSIATFQIARLVRAHFASGRGDRILSPGLGASDFESVPRPGSLATFQIARHRDRGSRHHLEFCAAKVGQPDFESGPDQRILNPPPKRAVTIFEIVRRSKSSPLSSCGAASIAFGYRIFSPRRDFSDFESGPDSSPFANFESARNSFEVLAASEVFVPFRV